MSENQISAIQKLTEHSYAKMQKRRSIMSKSIPVTDGTNVIYTIELKKDFGDLCKELTRLKISPDQKLCIVTDPM